ncbi:putative suppressor of action mutation 2-like protein [Naematelia encephala]|uniref:Putative suppressor of action mutation 2-like protein n=1 Tax=Naematelia encephala TaxID=71784 RepID=A0A1Y2BLP0_9TREE|nr:putative suppressor of action mutation 2-like protein [Naematelia encephala]
MSGKVPNGPNGHVEDRPLQSPGAGPSRLSLEDRIDEEEEEEEKERDLFLRHQKDYVELEQSVESSTELLSSLASYLSTFQNDLSEVSGQISDLQSKSAEIESQLRGRRTIQPPLLALLNDITLPPSLVLTMRDTAPAQNPELWLTCIPQLESKLSAIASRPKVASTQQLLPILEALRLKALTQLPPFLLSLIRPLKSASKGLSTNLAVLQTSLLLKYQPFYGFLVRQSPRLAKQVERGYVNAARAYYETGMRRYARALGQIKARTPEKSELIGIVSSEEAKVSVDNTPAGIRQAYDRLRYAELDVEGEAGSVVLAYMLDDKEFRTPVEALFRSLGLVLIDNASAEFTFIVRFFSRPPTPSAPPIRSREGTPMESPGTSHIDAMSEAGRSRLGSARRLGLTEINEPLRDAERIWHEVFDTALESCSLFYDGLIQPPPPAVPLLTIIRLNDRLLATCDARGTLPLIPYLQAWKMGMWPVYRKEMDQHVASLKRLADEAEGKGLAGFMGKGVKDGAVRQVAVRYAALFSCVVALSDEAEEAMIFSSMTRLRTELVRLVVAQSSRIKVLHERHSYLSSIYELILHELVSGPGQTTHPKLQSELSFFRTREEEARRRIAT